MMSMMSPEILMRIRHSLWTVVAGGVLLGLAGCNRVASDWKTAQAADTTESYQQFLQQHQDSEFAAQAQTRMRQLTEDREWQAASGQDTKEAYEQFLAQHADSKWAQEAHARLDNFQPTGVTAPAPLANAAPVPAAAPALAAPPPAAATEVVKPAPPVASKPAVSQPGSKSAPKPAAAAAKPPAKAPSKPAEKSAHTASNSGQHYAQLGAFSSRARAEEKWKTIHAQFAAELGSLKPHYSSSKSGSQVLYRLQVGLASSQQVQDLCAKLKKRSQVCIPVRD
jgi:hypothetical protein